MENIIKIMRVYGVQRVALIRQMTKTQNVQFTYQVCTVAEFLIKIKHEEVLHAGPHTLLELKRKFWIRKGRAVVKRVTKAC